VSSIIPILFVLFGVKKELKPDERGEVTFNISLKELESPSPPIDVYLYAKIQSCKKYGTPQSKIL
jgi:hypothetical protein